MSIYRTIPFIIITTVTIACFPAFAWEARVISVSDGDTITVESKQTQEHIKIRLRGVDSPERKQPYGESAKAFVHELLMGMIVDISETYTDRISAWWRWLFCLTVFLYRPRCLKRVLLGFGLGTVQTASHGSQCKTRPKGINVASGQMETLFRPGSGGKSVIPCGPDLSSIRYLELIGWVCFSKRNRCRAGVEIDYHMVGHTCFKD